MSTQMKRGIALAWRPELADLAIELADSGAMDFTEVLAENTAPRYLDRRLARLVDSRAAVVVHGVTLGLAGADEPDPARLRHLAAVGQAVRAPLISEHVAFVRAADTPDPLHGNVLEAGHLLPPPRTRDSLAVLVDNIRRAQDALPVPLAVENIAALFDWPEDEFDEPDFLSELVDRTGALLVLDLANLYASSIATGRDPIAQLRRFPLSHIAYGHVAGGRYVNDLYLDSHADDVVPPVLELVGAYGELCDAGLLLERDDDLDPVRMAAELECVRDALTKGAGRVGVIA
ncbi:multinuclear nonheme iron-dependent oxidase [Jongsikchunia kroppenstedtii]|uniref:multinuclear nonheme iron-dependent oxidase n=1 Tax=Jongsikchunia kroppenstedtii TaxID=1121721 RepID=UPI0003A47787|nr:DUF692 family multinuclear iron-containing protein [Jongsikchunia kroppenstedtii]